MKKIFLVGFLTIFVFSSFRTCTKENSDPSAPASIYYPDSSLDIQAVPEALRSNYDESFDRYTKVTAPNGKPIHIVAQTKVSNEQMVRARNVLQHYLTNFLDSQYGTDKSVVANKMTKNNAALDLLNGSDDGSISINTPGQWLFEEEIQVEGGDWYINQNYDHRDATFEEILHLVHDCGIGVDGHNTKPGVLPQYQTEIRAAQENALSNNLWGIGGEDVQDWLDELSDENSLSQEYLAALIDSYYGLWGGWTEGNKGMWGIYIAKTRKDILSKDPIGAQLLSYKFFHPYLTYNARILSEFEGTFSLKFKASLKYTNHSQYLKDITLTGNNNSNVVVNSLDNDISGNTGENTVIFSGNYAEYIVNQNNSKVTVTDTVPERDGINTLHNIEKIQFDDQTIAL